MGRGGKRRRRHNSSTLSPSEENNIEKDVDRKAEGSSSTAPASIADRQEGEACKRARVAASSTLKSSGGEDGRPKTAIQVSYFRDGEIQQNTTTNDVVELPPPMTLDQGGEDTNDITGNAFLKIWNYLGKGDSHFSTPSMIQQHLWSIMDGTPFHTIGIAPTGSGKTLAYGVPTLLSRRSVLVLVPTRELVRQIAQVYTKLSKAFEKVCTTSASSSSQTTPPPRVVTIFGGSDRAKQKAELFAKTDAATIVVATPGRLLDLLSSSSSSSSSSLPPFQPGWIVLDEADQLAKDDLAPQVEEILSKLPSSSTLRLALLSATYPEKVTATFQKWVGSEYVLVEVDSISSSSTGERKKQQQDDNKTGDDAESPDNNKRVGGALLSSRIPPNLTQVLHVCAEHKKPKKLIHTLRTIKKQNTQRNAPLGIVFFSRIEKVKYVSSLLDKEGITNVQLHSQLSTNERQANLHSFSVGKCPLLLATDLAARGIDIPSVKFVIQYDFPGNLQQYVHRSGRAGRPSLHKTTSGNNDEATVYSFFTRNLKVMAADMVELLEANDAWVDPNLRGLTTEAPEKEKKNKTNKQPVKASKKKQPVEASKKITASKPFDQEAKGGKSEGDDDADDDDDFKDLAPNRIVLKRASHVSDTSESDSSDDES
jgi:superfamily II DNA/RNA helicase